MLKYIYNAEDKVVVLVKQDYNVDYNKLWKLMIDKKINKTQLIKKAGITTNAMAKLGKGETVQLETLIKICKAMNCNLDDIVEIKDCL